MGIFAAYGAGFRAGKVAPTQVEYHKDGTKTVRFPTNPCRGFFKRIAWDSGYYDGQMKRFSRRPYDTY